MSSAVFTTTLPELMPVLSELTAREPIFHRPEFASDRAGFEHMISPDYWEVGASGRRYSRDFILRTLEQTPPIDAAAAGWQMSELGLRALAPDTYLFTYTLQQSDRLTRRATIWRSTPTGWQIFSTRAPSSPAMKTMLRPRRHSPPVTPPLKPPQP